MTLSYACYVVGGILMALEWGFGIGPPWLFLIGGVIFFAPLFIGGRQ